MEYIFENWNKLEYEYEEELFKKKKEKKMKRDINFIRLATQLFITIDTLKDYAEFFKKEKVNKELIKPIYNVMQILEYDMNEILERYENEEQINNN